MRNEKDEHQCKLISIRINSEIDILRFHNAVNCHYRDRDLLPLFILLLTEFIAISSIKVDRNLTAWEKKDPFELKTKMIMHIIDFWK